jgi:hypothetical protein
MVNFGVMKTDGGVETPPAPETKQGGTSIVGTICKLTFMIITIGYAVTIAVSCRVTGELIDKVEDYFCDTSIKMKKTNDSLVAMHQILDVNGIIVPQSPNAPVRFIVVVENGNVVGMYESKGGVISTIQTNQFEVLRR